MAKNDPEGACIYDAAIEDFRKKLARQFKFKHRDGQTEAPLGERLVPFLDHLDALAAAGTARLGEGTLLETLAYADGFDWYRIEPRHEFNARHRKAGATQLLGEHGIVFASGHFRRAAEAAGLTGLAFAVLYDKPNRNDPRAWYTCMATALLGRGVDHAWAPPYTPKTLDGDTRLGSAYATNKTARADRLDPMVRRLCQMFPPGELRLAGYDRQLAEALPHTDVACKPIIDGGGRWYGQGVYIARRAAQALVAAGVLQTTDVEPIEVVRADQLAGDPEVPALDRTVGPLPQSLRDAVAQRTSVPMADEPAAPSSKAAPGRSIRELLTRLEADVVQFEPFRGGQIDAAASAAGLTIPPAWRLILTRLGRADLGDFLPYAPAEWLTFQPDHAALAEADATLPRRMLAVGSTGTGDWFSLDLEHVAEDGDCPLLKFDHETNRCVDRWASVGEYLRERFRL